MAWPDTPTSGAPVTGGVVVQALRTIKAPGPILATDATVLIDSAVGPLTLPLPSPASCKAQRFTLKKISADTNAITITGGVIDGDPDGVQVMSQYEALAVVSDGSAFYVLYRG